MAPKVELADIAAAATDYDTAISAALSDDNANNLRAEGAPQQTVVNGWTAKDLLTIIARQNGDLMRLSSSDERIPALLLIGVLAVCWSGMTAMVGAPKAVAAPAPVPAQVPPAWPGNVG